MADVKYKPVRHDHEAFLKKALKRKGFRKAYEDLKEEYTLTREMLGARSRFGLTQETVAELMGCTLHRNALRHYTRTVFFHKRYLPFEIRDISIAVLSCSTECSHSCFLVCAERLANQPPAFWQPGSRA